MTAVTFRNCASVGSIARLEFLGENPTDTSRKQPHYNVASLHEYNRNDKSLLWVLLTYPQLQTHIGSHVAGSLLFYLQTPRRPQWIDAN